MKDSSADESVVFQKYASNLVEYVTNMHFSIRTETVEVQGCYMSSYGPIVSYQLKIGKQYQYLYSRRRYINLQKRLEVYRL